VIRRHASALDEAESRVNDVYFTWRGGGDTPVNGALDEMLTTWRKLGEHEELVLVWPDR
jgi:hypothetical protein